MIKQPQQYAGPLSRELLVFNSFARSIQRCSRQLMEVISTHMFLTGAVKRQRENLAAKKTKNGNYNNATI
ncbi:MAG: hypothetical protein EOP48_22100 [Sphingobacteriales bacterium]|nr:MAG: hypothetical protein EOP48_22100 [Sphingobacteriales bacterium]